MAAGWTFQGFTSFLLELYNRRTVIAITGDFDVDSDSVMRQAVAHVSALTLGCQPLRQFFL
jgi:hypothetical protein